MQPERGVIILLVECPKCLTAFEGAWLEPAERGEPVEPSRQLCGECGHSWEAGYPGYSFCAEA